MIIVVLWERAYELEQKIKVKNLTYEQRKDAQLYNCYTQILLDLDLYDGYKNYRKERDEQRNRNKDNQNNNS